MKLIELSKTGIHKGKYFAQVDDEDYDHLMQYAWQVTKHSHTNYATSGYHNDDGSHTLRMHRVIMEVVDPKVMCDHKDGNGLNNQRSNLRISTPSQNMFNTRKRKSNTTSKYKGVSYVKSGNKWRVYIMVDRKNIYVGRFVDEKEAAMAYNIAAKKYYKEFACLNIV